MKHLFGNRYRAYWSGNKTFWKNGIFIMRENNGRWKGRWGFHYNKLYFIGDIKSKDQYGRNGS